MEKILSERNAGQNLPSISAKQLCKRHAGLKVHVQEKTKKSNPSSHAVIIVIMKREYLHYTSSRIERRGQHAHCCLLADGNGFKDLIIPEGL